MKLHKIITVWEFLVFLFSLFLILFLLFYYFNGIESSFTHKGVKSLQKKKFTQAYQYFNQALMKNPFTPWPYINLALSYDFLNAPDKALKTYDIVSSHLAKKSKEAVFYSYFNKGELNGRLRLLEDALKNYQQALEFKYKEKIIKKNIELLFKYSQESQDNNRKGRQKENQSDMEQEQKDQPDKSESDIKQESEDQTEESQSDLEQESEDSHEEKGADSEQKSEDKQEEGGSDSEQKSEDENQEDSDLKNKETTPPKILSEKEQEAILKEIEKQENEVRSKFYKKKKIFGDKSKKDW